MKKSQPKLLEALTGEVLDADPVPPKIKLATIAEVRREMARVYRDARSGRVETGDASRLSYILAQIGKMIVDAEFEQRITRLEEVKNANR